MLSFGVSALPGNVQAQPYVAGSGDNITIPDDIVSVAAGSAVIATGGGIITGTDITVSSGATNRIPVVTAAGADSLITLNGASTITGNGIGVKMDTGGLVELGAGTVINIGGIEDGSAGIWVDRSTVPDGTMGDGIIININGATRTGREAWIGVAVTNAASSASFNNLTVQGTSVDVGAYATNGGALTLTNSNFTINGSTPGADIGYWPPGVFSGDWTFVNAKQTGLTAYSNASITAADTNITVNSSGGGAVRAYGNSAISLTGGTIAVNSAPAGGSSLASGLSANVSSSLDITGTTITVSGDTYNAVWVSTDSTLTSKSMSLTVTGSTAAGVVANTRSTATLTDSTIKMTGADGYGIWLTNNSHATMNSGSVELEGAGSNGVQIQDGTSSFTGNSATISATGASSNGVYNNGGTATLTDSIITATGSNSYGITTVGGTVTLTGTEIGVEGIGIRAGGTSPLVTMSGGSVTSTANALRVSGTNAQLDFSDSAVITGGNGVLLDAVTGGSGALTATNGVVMSGDMQAADLDSVTASLSNNTVWTGAARNIGATSITGDSTWNMTGNSDVASLVLDNSTLAYSAPTGDPTVLSSYKTLTVRGDYTGNGGLVVLNTWLGSDDSPTDRLVVQGNTAGSSLIRVDSSGGGGALITGNGIMLVNVQGDSAGQFALGNRVAAGAYEYFLFKGGVGADAADGNWYLRNTYTPAPTPDNPDPEPEAIVRPEVPTSMVIPPLAIEYGYSMLGTMQDRGGEIWTNAASGNGYGNVGAVYEERSVWCKGKNPHDPNAVVDPNNRYKCIVKVPVAKNSNDETRWARSGWARAIGSRGFQEPGNFLRRGPDYNYAFWGIQAGLDVFAREQADGTLDRAGVYVGYGQINSDVKGQFGGKAGTVNMDAYTLGGYWTHYSAQGWYTDAVVQGTWYSADAKSNYGQRIKPDGFGILGSLEAGYAFKLGSGWTLEPQAQIVYQNVSFDNASDSFGFVRFDDGDSLRGRLGARLTKTWDAAEGSTQPRLVTAFLRANLWHEFLGKTTTSWGTTDGFGMTPFSSYLGGTWGEIGAGVTAQVTDKVNVFATGSYNHSLDGKGREGWDGRLGLTAKW